MTEKEKHVSNSKIVKVRADMLKVHPVAQRNIVQAKLRKLVQSLDLDAIGILHGVEYEINGTKAIWIIDGQHRYRALLDTDLGEWIVEVKVHLDAKDDIRASELFLRLNDRSPVSPYDKFINEVTAKNQAALGTIRILGKHELKPEKFQADGNVTCVSALKKVYNSDGGKSLDNTLGTLIAAWGKRSCAVEGKMVEGLGMVFTKYDGTVDREALTGKLGKYPGGPHGLIGDAKGMLQYRRSSLAKCIAERIIDTYNSSRRVGRLEPL